MGPAVGARALNDTTDAATGSAIRDGRQIAAPGTTLSWPPPGWPARWPVALAGVATWFATAGGPRHDADSASYLWAARQLGQDPGSVLGTQTFDGVADPGRFPPLYPVLLWLSGAGGSIAFRIVTTIVAMATVALVVVPLRRDASPWTAAAAGVLVLCARPFLFRLQAFVMSDAWFLWCSVGAVATVTRAVQATSPRAWRGWVATTAALVAAAALLRVSGAGLVVAAAAALMLLVPGRSGRRAAAAVTVAGLGPLLVWLSLQQGTDTVAARSLSWYGIGWSELRAAADSWLVMVLPGEVASGTVGVLAGSLLLVGLVLSLAWSARRLRDAGDGRRPPLQAVWLLVGWWSLAVLVLSRAVADPFLEPTDRHLMTAWTAAVCVAALELGVAARSARPTSVLGVTRLVGAGLVVAALVVTVSNLSHPDEVYRSLEQEAADSAILAVTVDLPEGVPLHSNRGDLLFVVAGRPSRHVPLPSDPSTSRTVDGYREQLHSMVQEVCVSNGAVMAVLSDAPWSPDIADLTSAGLIITARRPDGVLLRCTP